MFKIFKKYLMYLVILGLLTQTSFIGNLFKPQTAHATTKNITKIVLISSQSTVKTNQVILITAQTKNLSDGLEYVDEDNVLNFSVAGSSGQFSLNGTDGWTSTLPATLEASKSSVAIYYKDSISETSSISALATGHDWSNAPLSITTVGQVDASKVTLNQNPPTENDTICGSAGSALNGAIIKAYFDSSLSESNLIGSTAAASDGSFSSIDIGDNLYSAVYLTQTLIGVESNSIITTNDIIAPTGSIQINLNADVTQSKNVSLSLFPSTGTTDVKITGDIEGPKDWESFTESPISKTLSGDNGYKTIYAQFKDAAGNQSPIYTAHIFYNDKSSAVNSTSISTSQTQYSPFSENDVEMTINSNTSTTLYSSRYSQNPVGQSPTGISVMGKYFDFSVASKDAINFPVYVKIYFTETDMKNAGITDIKQIKGLYYYDFSSQTWKLYSSTGAVANTTGGYAGYVWANLDHFTPMTIGAKTIAPAKPTNFTAKAGDGEINLSWDKVADAKGYNIRYREGTSIDNASYTTVYISGADTLSTKINNLKNATLYEFGIQAVDDFDNKSDWGVVVSSPVASTVTTASTTTEDTASKAKAKYYYASTTPTETKTTEEAKSEESEVVTVGPEQGEVKADETTEATRTWVTIAIILIAIGAGAGGYYGYQWWLAQEKVKPTPPPTKPDKKNKPSGRW